MAGRAEAGGQVPDHRAVGALDQGRSVPAAWTRPGRCRHL